MKLESVTVTCSPRPQGRDRQGKHHHRQRRRQEEGYRSRVGQIKAQIERLPRTTTVRSCRSAWPSSPAASRSFASARTEIEVKEKKDRVEDALNATAPPCRKASCRAAASRCCAPKKAVGRITTTIPTSSRYQYRAESAGSAGPPDRENAGVEGSIVVGKSLRTRPNFRLRCADRRVCRYGRKGHHRSGQVVRTALQDAASVAALLVTTEAMVAELPKEAAPPMHGVVVAAGWNGGMGF